MKYIKILPPGSWCNHQAFLDVIKTSQPNAKTFVDIGCGSGELSKELLKLGMIGAGLDFSEAALEQAKTNLADAVSQSRYQLIRQDATETLKLTQSFDLGVCNMVMEHIKEDVQFVQQCSRLIKPGGNLIFAVPSRMDHWSLEDDTVGHLRRYEKHNLLETLQQGGLKNPKVISVAVPISNLLFSLSKRAVNTPQENSKLTQLSTEQQTKYSGIREIPWKTVFPIWVKFLLNRYTLWPLFVLQRLFYPTELGVVMIGWGQTPYTTGED